MGEEKEKLDRLQAKLGGHRTVVTKNINEARTILEHTHLEDIMWSRVKVVKQTLEEKLILLAGFDKEITKICSVDHIEEEIKVAAEILTLGLRLGLGLGLTPGKTISVENLKPNAKDEYRQRLLRKNHQKY